MSFTLYLYYEKSMLKPIMFLKFMFVWSIEFLLGIQYFGIQYFLRSVLYGSLIVYFFFIYIFYF